MAQRPFARVLRTGKLSGVGRVPAALRAAMRRKLETYAYLIAAHIKTSMRRPKSGRWYSYKGRKYRASAPGESPAVRSGRLYRSIIPVYSKNGRQMRIAPKVPYAAPLERGTKDGRLKRRPYIQPAFDAYRNLFRSSIRDMVKEHIRRTGG